YLVGEMALAGAQLERCAQLDRIDLQRCMDRAAPACWKQDRALAAEELGAELAKAPRRVRRALLKTVQGLDWLIDHWTALGGIAKKAGAWDEAQRRLALDLLGVPHELRANGDALPAADDAARLVALAERQLERLTSRRELLARLDEGERE